MKHLILKTWIFRASVIVGVLIALANTLWDPLSVGTLWSLLTRDLGYVWISILWDGYFFQTIFLILFFVISIKSLVFAYQESKKYGVLAILPLLFNAIIWIIFIPLNEITIDENFHSKLDSRISVVQKVKSGELAGNVDYNPSLIHLPIWYFPLSVGGNDIVFEHGDDGSLNVLFYTYRGVVDNFAGIVYKENNLSPTPDDFGCGTLLDSKKFQDNWFWMSCT